MPPAAQRKQIGRYSNLSLLGQGGMGAVYRALDPSLDRTVALKVVLDQNPHFLARFEREAKAVARLSHANIVQVYDFGQDDDGNPYFVMELVKGRSVDQLLKEQGPLSPKQAVDLLIQAAKGLEAAHAVGIVHRDIKPHNMLLDGSGLLKLCDFGIARVAGVQDGLTTGNEALGTLHYMAPEVLSGQQADARADIYGLGLVGFHLLTGKPPFQGDSAVGIAMKQLNEPLPDLQKDAPQTPAALRHLIEKMTVKDRDKRVQSCAEVGRQLTLIAEQLDETAKVSAQALPPGGRRIILLAAGLGLASAAVLGLVLSGAGSKRRRAMVQQPQPVAVAANTAAAAPTPAVPAASAKAKSRPTGPVRIAVLRFRNLGTLADQTDPGQGLAEAIPDAFNGLRDRVQLVERNQFDEFNLAELKLNQEGFMDKESAAKWGRVLGTELLVQGAFQRIDKTLRITARISRTDSDEILDSVTLTEPFASASDVFTIHDHVAAAVRDHVLKLLPQLRP